MKNVSAFLKRHSALLLLVLVLATVPAGIAFGKYVKSVNVTNGISVTVSAATPADNYTIDKDKMQRALKDLGENSTITITELKFVGGSGVPDEVDATYGKSIHDTDITPESGKIYAYRKGNVIYIAPADGVDKVMYAPEESDSLFEDWFVGKVAKSLTSISFNNLNTSEVTNMSRMFYGCNSLSSLDLRNFDTRNVIDMYSMFEECSGLKSLNMSSFNTSSVTTMYFMFQGCSGLTSLNVSNFDTSSVTSMSHIFETCSSLTSLDVSSFNTSNVTSMDNMFDGCTSLTSLDLSNFDTRNVTTMSAMFQGCSGLTSLNVSSFDTSKVTSMSNMFRKCTALTTLDVSNFNTSNVTSMEGMFSACSLTSLDLSSFDTYKVTNMKYMFYNCSNLTTIKVSNEFTTGNVTNSTNSFYMFQGCEKLVGGKGTPYNSSKTDKTYAWIDGKDKKPGYFTGDATSTLSVTGSIEGSGISLGS